MRVAWQDGGSKAAAQRRGRHFGRATQRDRSTVGTAWQNMFLTTIAGNGQDNRSSRTRLFAEMAIATLTLCRPDGKHAYMRMHAYMHADIHNHTYVPEIRQRHGSSGVMLDVLDYLFFVHIIRQHVPRVWVRWQ